MKDDTNDLKRYDDAGDAGCRCWYHTSNVIVVLLVPIDRSLPFNLLGGGNNHRPSFERLSVVRWFLGLEILEKFHSQVPILVNPIYCDV